MPKNNDRTRGIYQKILSDEVEIDGKACKVETVYFHLDRVRRYVGDGIDNNDYVRAGSIIGWSDNTGVYTTGAHLHFGMRILWKDAKGNYNPTNDVYKGYVDPVKYFTFKYKRV
jgi:murein DD-endopeptidase MepM/ murein hydrolase activator NlpD